MSFPPANSTRVPSASSAARVCSSRRETAAMEGSASPRNPRVAIESRSSAVRSFDVACRSNAKSASSWIIPLPSSITRIIRFPPDSTSTRIERAPASSAFSSSSFTTDAGLSTTSPAAILFATCSASMRIRVIEFIVAPTFRLASWICTLARLKAGSTRLTESLFFRNWLQLHTKKIELILINRGRRVRHQVLRLCRLREGDHFADGLFASEQSSNTVETQSDAAVRRCPIRQRIEEEAEAISTLLLAEAQHLEHAVLQLLLVDSNAARAKFDAVQHQVVTFRTHGQSHLVGRIF